jgi:hypothetical protein
MSEPASVVNTIEPRALDANMLRVMMAAAREQFSGASGPRRRRLIDCVVS